MDYFRKVETRLHTVIAARSLAVAQANVRAIRHARDFERLLDIARAVQTAVPHENAYESAIKAVYEQTATEVQLHALSRACFLLRNNVTEACDRESARIADLDNLFPVSAE